MMFNSCTQSRWVKYKRTFFQSRDAEDIRCADAASVQVTHSWYNESVSVRYLYIVSLAIRYTCKNSILYHQSSLVACHDKYKFNMHYASQEFDQIFPRIKVKQSSFSLISDPPHMSLLETDMCKLWPRCEYFTPPLWVLPGYGDVNIRLHFQMRTWLKCQKKALTVTTVWLRCA